MMKTIDDFAAEGLRVLVRADLNVPLDGKAAPGQTGGKTLPGLAVLEAS